MASKLEIYNNALLILGERKLSSLTEDVEPRYVLDDAYDRCLAVCLSASGWNFGMRTVVIDSSTTVDPDFGYTYAFLQPTDYIRTFQISDNENLYPPLQDYTHESGYWYAWVDPIYVKYLSNDAGYGMDIANWPSSFSEFVETALARRICRRITSSEEKLKLIYQLEQRMAKTAIGRDSIGDPVTFPPRGTWATSRGAKRSFDRTPTGTLTG